MSEGSTRQRIRELETVQERLLDTVGQMHSRLEVVEKALMGVYRQGPHRTHSLTAEQMSGDHVIVDPIQHEHATGVFAVVVGDGP